MSGAVGRIPILRLGEVLLVTVQVEVDDRLALRLQDDLMTQIVRHRARGVLIDVSALDLVDSFIARTLATIASMARVLDAHTVVTGIQPAVAITLVELGAPLPGVRTALDVDRGMALLRTALAGEAGEEAPGVDTECAPAGRGRTSGAGGDGHGSSE